jgi:hypothetical protein
MVANLLNDRPLRSARKLVPSRRALILWSCLCVAAAGCKEDETVGTAAASASESGATVPETIIAGSAIGIQVEARDENGQSMDGGGAIVAATITGANPGELFATDNANGTYTLNYAPANAGTDVITITINEEEIADSPFTVEVTAPPTALRR